MGEAEAAGPWFCGPEQNRGAYVVRDLGGIEGGQGLVVRAERRTFQGDPVGHEGSVALKLLTEVDDGRVATLRRRWELLAEIDHPHLARPVEIFQGPGLSRNPHPDPRPEDSKDVCYAAAVWIEGSGLREVSPLEPASAFTLARDVAAGLEALHGRGLLHRDLHPGNVIVGTAGRAVLIDFGAAREADGTFTTTVSGVVGFIAPECLNGPSTVASDRWGLGMLTVFALLGHPEGTTRPDQLRAELRTALAGIGQRRRAVELLTRMIDANPDRRPLDVTGWAQELTECLAPPSRPRRLLLPAAAATAAAALVTGAVLAEPWDDGMTRSVPTTSTTPVCDRTVDAPPSQPAGTTQPGQTGQPSQTGGAGTTGQPSQPAGTGPVEQPGQSAEGRQPPHDDLVAAVERLASDACLAGPPTNHALAGVQELVTADGRPDGVVMVTPNGASVRLTEAMWTSYGEAAGTAGPAPPQDQVRLRGYPTEIAHLENPQGVELRLDGGGILVGPRDDTRIFWLPGRVIDQWRQRGGPSGELGFPMSNTYRDDRGLHLEFERGTMHAYGDAAAVDEMIAGGPVPLEVELHDPALARTGNVTSGIIRQPDGTSWWVDAEGARHWIPDRETWSCLGGAGEVALDQLPGWEVAALPLGPAATCPEGGSQP